MTPLDIKERCIEAVETILNTPGRVGPGTKSGYWPEYNVHLYPNAKRIPTAEEIARCDQFTDWVNRLESQYERQQIWQWGFLKVRQDRTIRGYCEKLGLFEHEYRREISKIFQKLIEIARHSGSMRQNPAVDAILFQGEKSVSSELPREREKNSPYQTIFSVREDGAKPEHQPDSAEHKSLVKRLLKKQENRVGA